MKNFVIATIAIFIAIQTAHAQTVSECEKIVQITYDCVNRKSSTALEPHLAEDFTIAGQTGFIAPMVLAQVFPQLNDNVTNIRKLEETQTDVLTLVYEADFKTLGTKKSTFIFDQNNKLKELILLETMKVQTKVASSDMNTNGANFFSVPFKKVGKLILVKAYVNGHERNFLVDSGCPILVLNSAHLSKDTTHAHSYSTMQGIGGSIDGVNLEKVGRFEFGAITMDNEEVVTMDLSHLEKELKTKIHGLIGYEVFKNFDMLFDYSKKTLTFIQPELSEQILSERYKKKAFVSVPIELQGHIAVVEASINNENYKLGIDSGAESNVLAHDITNKMLPYLSNVKEDKMIGADKNEVPVKRGKLNEIKIGATPFAKTSTVFSDLSELNDSYQMRLDGLIGYEVLSKQPTLVSYENQRIVFVR
jgi:predicted aspartyl protease